MAVYVSLQYPVFTSFGYIPRSKISGSHGSSGFPSGSAVKNLPAMQETQVRSLGQEDPLEKEMTTHSSILAWKIPMDRGAWRATVHRVAKSQTRLKQLSMRAW